MESISFYLTQNIILSKNIALCLLKNWTGSFYISSKVHVSPMILCKRSFFVDHSRKNDSTKSISSLREWFEKKPRVRQLLAKVKAITALCYFLVSMKKFSMVPDIRFNCMIIGLY